MSGLCPKNEVLKRLFRAWHPPEVTEEILVTEAQKRVPSRDYFSILSIPVVRSAQMDGVAVISSRFVSGIPDTSQWQSGRDYVRADMGDDFDDIFDAVVLVEDVKISSAGLDFLDGLEVRPGLNIRQAGSQIRQGDLLVERYRFLLPKDLAMLQMGGIERIEVLRKPLVAFIPTGKELINPGISLTRGKNIDTNSILVRETLTDFGAEVWNFPIVSDEKHSLSEALDKALEKSDIIIINGGSSKGLEDFNAGLLESRGQKIVQGVAAAPGKPMGIFIINGKPVINLPGPMIAAYYGLEWCISSVVNRFLHQPCRKREAVKAVLTEDLNGPKGLSFLFNIKLERRVDGQLSATPLDPRVVRTSQGIAAEAQYMSNLEGEYLPAGTEIIVELLRVMP